MSRFDSCESVISYAAEIIFWLASVLSGSNNAGVRGHQ